MLERIMRPRFFAPALLSVSLLGCKAGCTEKAAPVASSVRSVTVNGASMVGNSEFNLTSGKIYSYNGSVITVSGDRFRVKYNSAGQYSGAVHTWGETPEWNGAPIDIKPYSELTITIEGNPANTKFELNDTEVIGFGKLHAGANVIDLAPLKRDSFSPLTELRKINLVNMPGQGEYIVSLSIK